MRVTSSKAVGISRSSGRQAPRTATHSGASSRCPTQPVEAAAISFQTARNTAGNTRRTSVNPNIPTSAWTPGTSTTPSSRPISITAATSSSICPDASSLIHVESSQISHPKFPGSFSSTADLGGTLLVSQGPGPTSKRRRKAKRGHNHIPAAASWLPPFSHQVDLSDSDGLSSPRAPGSYPSIVSSPPSQSASRSSSRSPSLLRNLHTTLLLFTCILVAGTLPILLHSIVPSLLSSPLSPFHIPSHQPPPATTRISATADTIGAGSSPSPIPPSLPPPPSEYESAQVRVVVIVPESATSPMGGAPWGEAMTHLASRFSWTDPEYAMKVIFAEDLAAPGSHQDSAKSTFDLAQIVVGFGVHDQGAVRFLEENIFGNQRSGQTVFFLNSASSLEKTKHLGGWAWEEGGVSSPLKQLLPWNWNNDKKAELVATVKELWHRGDSDNVLFAVLVLVNEYVRSVPAVKSSAKGMDPLSLFCIMRHCFPKVQDCIQNPTCKTALDCLNACSFNDQVCQYRCIVSYETPQLESFSLCILQLHNCRRLTASPPPIPDPAPLSTFQGAPMTHEAAEKVLRGWLGESSVSWMVSGGKNPAYDYFPCQHQLFFPGKAKGAYWYEPVFKVKTLDGGEVWRRRRYRVRRGKLPGTFFFTVLDNGVTSKEFWRLLDAGDDLSFALFYYSGAASAAGMSYTGAILATPDGQAPAAEHLPRIEAALERAGIKTWELSSVDNSNCVGAPLELSDEAKTTMAAFAW